jgi:hypothetical protein
MKAHNKWDAIDHEINIRKHQAAMKKAGQALAAATASSSSSSNTNCAA